MQGSRYAHLCNAMHHFGLEICTEFNTHTFGGKAFRLKKKKKTTDFLTSRAGSVLITYRADPLQAVLTIEGRQGGD